jgi:2-octaprenylphenol hydroxylase
MDVISAAQFAVAILGHFVMNTSSYDIIIVGGGMVGLTLASVLAEQTALSIAVLEAKNQTFTFSPQHYSHRVSAITLSSQRIFEFLQIWRNIQKKRVSPFTQIDVWDAQTSGEIQFRSQDIAESLLGYIIENNIIQEVLEEKIKQFAQVEYISPVTLKAFSQTENGVQLVLDDDRLLQAKLAVAADGANSWLRSKAGIQVERYDYEQEAIVATVTTERAHEQIARQVFLETGPLAHLPLAMDHLSSIVWSLPSKQAKELLALDENHFGQKLGQAFSHRLGNILEVKERYLFPLYKQKAHAYVSSRVVLVGDAAHTIHPLAGQGVNMGLLDAASLAQVIVDAIKERRDIANHAVLRRYERWRKADNLFLLAGVDAIKHLFASKHKSIELIRSFGLNATNRTQWIKNLFTRHAVGDRDGLPHIAK